MTTLIEAKARVEKAQKELIEAETEVLNLTLLDLEPKDADVFNVKEDDSLHLNSDADEIYVNAGDGSTLNLHGHTGIVHVHAGDGSMITFQSDVAGANLVQGSGGSATFFKSIDTLNIEQGPGSEVLSASEL